MQKHVRALFTQNADSRLLLVNEPNGAPFPAPRLFLGRTRAGNIWQFRADVPENIIRELDALCGEESAINNEFNEPHRNLENFVRVLEKHALVEKISSGPAYQFADFQTSSESSLIAVTENNVELLRGGFDDLMADAAIEQPFVARVEENRVVSVCRSVRITPEAYEAGLETLPEFRGRNYAKNVAAEWARRVRALGVIPLYSTSWENTASQAVARKLGLRCYGADFQII
jgi:ribosomal protein S18 acetylase RimI-like enzyme